VKRITENLFSVAFPREFLVLQFLARIKFHHHFIITPIQIAFTKKLWGSCRK